MQKGAMEQVEEGGERDKEKEKKTWLILEDKEKQL